MANLLGDMCVSWDFSSSDCKVDGLEDKSQETHICSACALSLSKKQSTRRRVAVPAHPTESLVLSEVSSLEQRASVQLQTHSVEKTS